MGKNLEVVWRYRLREERERERERKKKKKGCCCFLFFNANTMSNPLDISALTAAAVAELHKQQVASSANSGMPSASNVQEQMQQLKQRQESAAAVVAAAVSNNPITTSIALPATVPATKISTSDSKLQMPTRHSWEMDWLSCELVKAREQIKKLKEENEQLRLKLESQNQFVVHSSRPVQQQAALDLTKQQNLEALLKSNQQLQAQLNPSLFQHATQASIQQAALQQALGIQQAMPAQLNQNNILAQNISQLAGLTASKPDLGKLSAAAGATQTQNLHELQKQMLGTSNFQELQNLCDQASVSSGPMDMSKVEKLLLAVQAEAAKKQ